MQMPFQMMSSETTDSDNDGVGDNADAFPFDDLEDTDTDGDGVGDNADAFPNDDSETTDSDNDGVGDNADAFPFDDLEDTDTDGDGVGDNADAFPFDDLEDTDTDGDGVGDNADAFPNDDSETADSDNDGVGDNADAFPNDPSRALDSDGDGIEDGEDNCVDLANYNQSDFDEDGLGDLCDPDRDDDGFADFNEANELLDLCPYTRMSDFIYNNGRAVSTFGCLAKSNDLEGYYADTIYLDDERLTVDELEGLYYSHPYKNTSKGETYGTFEMELLNINNSASFRDQFKIRFYVRANKTVKFTRVRPSRRQGFSGSLRANTTTQDFDFTAGNRRTGFEINNLREGDKLILDDCCGVPSDLTVSFNPNASRNLNKPIIMIRSFGSLRGDLKFEDVEVRFPMEGVYGDLSHADLQFEDSKVHLGDWSRLISVYSEIQKQNRLFEVGGNEFIFSGSNNVWNLNSESHNLSYMLSANKFAFLTSVQGSRVFKVILPDNYSRNIGNCSSAFNNPSLYGVDNFDSFNCQATSVSGAVFGSMGSEYTGFKYIDFRDYFYKHTDINFDMLGIPSKTLMFVNGLDTVYSSQLEEYDHLNVICRSSYELYTEGYDLCDCILSDEFISELKGYLNPNHDIHNVIVAEVVMLDIIQNACNRAVNVH